MTSVVLIFGHTLAGLVVTGNGTGGLICFDGSSRASGDFSGISDNGGTQVGCSGF